MSAVTGTVAMATIHAVVSVKHSIRAKVTESDFVVGDLPYYEGEYTVTPSLDAQILPTRGTAMSDDMVITEIPYYEISNPQGGYTAIIGGN